MLQSIAMKAEQQISSLIAHWNADVAYMELWESYLTALEVSEGGDIYSFISVAFIHPSLL